MLPDFAYLDISKQAQGMLCSETSDKVTVKLLHAIDSSATMQAMNLSQSCIFRRAAGPAQALCRSSRRFGNRPTVKRFAVADGSSGALTEKRCEPCESTTGSLDYMGLCMALSKQEAESFLSKAKITKSLSSGVTR